MTSINVGFAQITFEHYRNHSRVVGRAGEVFEDLDAALDWLKSANSALSGATPLSLLDTDIGAESVLDTLGRIEHGVFA